jgi:hypothetical protein
VESLLGDPKGIRLWGLESQEKPVVSNYRRPTSSTLLFFFLVALGFELGLMLARFLPLGSLLQPFNVMGFFEMGSLSTCLGLASNCDPPDLCLLSS